MNADDIRRRCLISIQFDYEWWLRYGDAHSRASARNVAWVLSGVYNVRPRWQGPRDQYGFPMIATRGDDRVA